MGHLVRSIRGAIVHDQEVEPRREIRRDFQQSTYVSQEGVLRVVGRQNNAK